MAAVATTGKFVRPNTFKLDGVESPGICRFSGAALKRKYDTRAGYGTSGATDVYAGDDVSEFQCVLTFNDWDHGQRDEWLDFARQVFVKPPNTKGTTQPKAQRLEYWEVNDPPVSITAVNVVEVGQPDTSDDTGLVRVTIKFKQYRPPKSGLGKPTGVNVPGKKNQPTAQDAADQQIAALVQQLKTEVAKG